MRKTILASLSLAVAALLPSVTSCSSDPSPFDWTISSTDNNATVQINLNVEETRAGGLSTSDEMKINNLSVYVFNSNHKLESKKDFTVSDLVDTDGKKTVSFEVSHGLKTLYVVTAKTNVNPSVGTSLTDYEKSVFNSSLSNIKPEKTVIGEDDVETKSVEYVMVGKSKEQQVMISASQDDLPASNKFNITLVRLVAKAQVKTGSDMKVADFGITFGEASFRASQLNERMRVVHDGTDVFDDSSSSYVDSNKNGTYDFYTRGVGEYQIAKTSDFTADGCAYMSENIVSKPLSGNTTFLSIRFATTPAKYYTFDSASSSVKATSDTPGALTTYYAVGIQDKINGMVDYALVPGSKNIVTFKTEEEAQKYKTSLNNGTASAITVSQTDKPMKASEVAENAASTPQFEVIAFDKGYVYYRVNIAHEDSSGDTTTQKKMVQRNKFYKVNINSVKSLGFSSETLLIPTEPKTVLDAEGHAWISASISVAPWEEVEQNVDL